MIDSTNWCWPDRNAFINNQPVDKTWEKVQSNQLALVGYFSKEELKKIRDMRTKEETSKSKKLKAIITRGAGFKIEQRALEYVLFSQIENNIEASYLRKTFRKNTTILPTGFNPPPQEKLSPQYLFPPNNLKSATNIQKNRAATRLQATHRLH